MTRKPPAKPAADEPIWQRAETESPCVKICVIHTEARLCIGCLRSVDEIAQWSRLDPAARAAVLAALPDRREDLARKTRRRGGRAARLARRAED